MTPSVVIVEYNELLRTCLQHLLAGAGYTTTGLPTFDSALAHLYTAADPVVVVAGNATSANWLETTFFTAVAADAQLSARHRYVLLTTTPEQLPAILRLHLDHLHAPIVKKPFDPDDMLNTVADLVRRALWPACPCA